VSILAKRLIRVTRECMDLAIETIKPGMHLGMIGEVIQKHAEKNGFSVVREYCGHGIGKPFMKTRRCCITVRRMKDRCCKPA